MTSVAAECWHQFNRVGGDAFYGSGTVEQAQRYLKRRNSHLAANHYALTTLDDDGIPPDGALMVDLASGDFLPDRYKRLGPHGG